MIGRILDQRWPLDKAPGAQDEERLQERAWAKKASAEPGIQDLPNGAM